MDYLTSVLTEFFLVSMCMFTLPFVSYFGTQHIIKEYYPSALPAGWDFILPIAASIITVWVIISLYIVRALKDPQNFSDDDKKTE